MFMNRTPGTNHEEMIALSSMEHSVDNFTSTYETNLLKIYRQRSIYNIVVLFLGT